MDYLQAADEAASNVLYGVDPKAQVGLVTFAADAYSQDSTNYVRYLYSKDETDGNGKTFVQALNSVVLKGGTDQRDGLNEGTNLFTEEGRNNSPVPKRVAILITDGAPNQTGVDWPGTITTAANGLKNKYAQDQCVRKIAED